MLSGYAPSAAAVEAVGAIGMDLQRKAEKNPGSFFWGELPSLSVLCGGSNNHAQSWTP